MEPKELAKQLRTPEGEAGIKVGKFMNEGNAFISDQAYRLMKADDGDYILEIGPGNGAFVPQVLSLAKDINYRAIDISQTMIDEFKDFNKAHIENGNVAIELAGIDKIPFADGTFDKCCTINTLYFWPNPIENLKELKRVLKKQARLVIAIRPTTAVEELPFVQYGFNLYQTEEIQSFLKEAGFKIIDTIERQDPEIEWQGERMSPKSMYFIAG
jgi:ubiquinone/menaquinone biosynthesis C-methylase UbiE